jgi:phosphoribosylformylglycinamidine synthase
MISRIEVDFKKNVVDALGNSIKKKIEENLKIKADSVKTVDVYTIDSNLSNEELNILGEVLFADPVIQNFTVDKPIAENFDWLIEVGFKPGVTDNVGRTAKEGIEDIFKIKTKINGVYTSKQYVITGDIGKGEVERIASDLLANQLIERWEIINHKEWKGVKAFVPVVRIAHEPEVSEINLDVSNEELKRISKEGILALSLEEMKAIKDYYKNEKTIEERKKVGLANKPTDVELETLAQTWSEHCKHKIFNAIIDYKDGSKSLKINSLFKTFIKKSTEEIARDWLVSAFKDNAGVIRFNDGWNLVMKVETHNSPSALDPYGGALTGIVGVNRDSMGTGIGSKLIFNTDVFCFASPFYEKSLPPRLMHPKRIFEGVRKGVEHGGNKSGIPTVNGSIVFDDRFLGKPLVYCGTGGIMPSEIDGRKTHLKIIEPSDLAVMCGGRIGKDGIHGATFSSEELHEDSPATAVQIGDPITQKKMSDFLLEARDLGLYRTLTDNGAGGLSSSIGELAQISGGCQIYLDKCPLKYAGLNPWEILLSEAQERMTVVVEPEKLDEFLKLAERRGVESTVVGKFTDSDKFHAFYNDKTVAYIDMKFLHEGVPQMNLKAVWEKPQHDEINMKCPEDLTGALKKILSRLNICSKEYVVRQYDHEVQGGSVIKPLTGLKNDGPSDAAVVRPVLESMEGVVVAHGICPRYSDIDAYDMAACAMDEAVRNYVSVGGSLNHMAALDNFCWCDPVKSDKTPDGELKLAQLVRACQALYDCSTYYKIPLISGKDSMKNDYMIGGIKISIPPTLLISVIGKINDARKAVSMDAKKEGDSVYILGLTKNELGGSEYYAMYDKIGNSVPSVNLESALKLYEALDKAMNDKLVSSCHDCSDGGLAVAIAETAFAGGLGMIVDLRKVPKEDINRNDFLLFSESQSRFVVTVNPQDEKRFEDAIRESVFAKIGRITKNDFIVYGLDGKVCIKSGINELKEAWQKTLRW